MAVFLSLGFITACSLKDTAEDIKNTSRSIENVSQRLAKRTNDLEAELTKKESFAMFVARTQDLFGESLQKNPSESDMLFYAGAAVESLLFQYWKGDFDEDLMELDLRYKFSAEILFVKTLRYIPRTFDVDVTPAVGGPYEGIASFGGKLDRMTDNFRSNLRKYGLPETSLYDVIVTALQNRNQLERKEQFPRATEMILQFRREAIYMLQLRHNYLPMMVLGRITDLQDRGLLGRAWMTLSGRGTVVDLNNAEFSAPELQEWTQWLNNAMATRTALRNMGIEPKYNSKFVAILKQIEFGQKGLLSLTPASLTPLKRLQRDFAQAFVNVVEDSQRPVLKVAPVLPETYDQSAVVRPMAVSPGMDWSKDVDAPKN